MRSGEQSAIAKEQGFGANTLSEQKSGKRPATLEMVEHVARHRRYSAKRLLDDLVEIASELNRVSPGWDALPESGGAKVVPPNQYLAEAERHLQQRQARRRAKNGDAKPRKVDKRH